MKPLVFRPLPLAMALALALPAAVTQAQTAPDAGQTLQQTQPPTLQAPRTGPAIGIQSPAVATTTPGGATVKVSTIQIGGASVFSEAELLAVLGDFAGKSYDLAGLRGLADRLTAHYREAGYPFARAYIPAQPMTDGTLRIEVIEGRYGQVQALGDKDLVAAAAGFLSPLKTSRATVCPSRSTSTGATASGAAASPTAVWPTPLAG